MAMQKEYSFHDYNPPSRPNDDWVVESHRMMKKLGGYPDWHFPLEIWSGARLVPVDMGGGTERRVRQIAEREQANGNEMLNACVMEFLLGNQELIPESWRKDEKGLPVYVIFAATTYVVTGGFLRTRCMAFSDQVGSWQEVYSVGSLWSCTVAVPVV